MSRETFAERLKRIRETKGFTQGELARLSNVDPSYVSQLEKDIRKGELSEATARIAGALEVSVNELMGRTVIHELHSGQTTTEVPLRGYVAAGTPRETYEADLGTVSVPAFVLDQFPQAFALVVSGDSLQGDSISDGDLVVVDPSAGLQIGKIYIIRLEDETVARHLFIEEGHVRLKSANDHYVDLKVSELNIIGRVVWHMRKM